MDYAEWMNLFDSYATTDRFKDVPLDRDLMDELFDMGLSVQNALTEYLIRKPEHKATKN